MDDITGLYDHGARERNPITAVWYGIDEFFEKYPEFGPYNYCGGNPVRYFDPDGRRRFNVQSDDGTIHSMQIPDGKDDSYDIQESDFKLLQLAFNNDETKDKEEYNDYFGRLGLGKIGYEIAVSARKWENNESYAFDKKKDDFPANRDKCNKFVYDRLREFDAIEEYPYGCPPLAKHYADPDFRIVGLPVVYDGEVHLGDVISGAHDYYDSQATGHVEIVTYVYPNKGLKMPDGNPLPKNYFLTTGAGGSSVVTSRKGYNMLNGSTFKDRGGTFLYNPVSIRRSTRP